MEVVKQIADVEGYTNLSRFVWPEGRRFATLLGGSAALFLVPGSACARPGPRCRGRSRLTLKGGMTYAPIRTKHVRTGADAGGSRDWSLSCRRSTQVRASLTRLFAEGRRTAPIPEELAGSLPSHSPSLNGSSALRSLKSHERNVMKTVIIIVVALLIVGAIGMVVLGAAA